jgi:hypothetical protein
MRPELQIVMQIASDSLFRVGEVDVSGAKPSRSGCRNTGWNKARWAAVSSLRNCGEARAPTGALRGACVPLVSKAR